MQDMCMLAIFFRVIEGCPVLVAAIREEFYDRQGTEPELWQGVSTFVAGRDPRAGGTWLGVNEHGVLVAITNRPKLGQPSEPRSRGLLCRDLLASRSARAAHEWAIEELHRCDYAGCNLLMIDAADAYVVQQEASARSGRLSTGIQIVTARGLNESTDERAVRILEELNGRDPRPKNEWIGDLQRLCGDHGNSTGPPICLHAADRGTISSSIIALPENVNQARWLHAQGPPCRTAFKDFSHLVVRLVQSQ